MPFAWIVRFPSARSRPRPGKAIRAGRGLLLVAALAGSAAAGPLFPLMTGELSGDFQPLLLAGAPKVHWKFSLTGDAKTPQAAVLVADGPGTHLRAELQLDAAGNGTWRVVEGHVETKAWLNGQVTKGSADVSGTGRLQDGKVSGDLTLRLQDVDLGELLLFADAEHAYVQTARGKVEGTIGLRLRDGVLSAGDSALRLPASTVGAITFRPSPGLLSAYVPEQVLAQYPGIRAIELGQTALEAKTLRLVFRPDGDRQGRGAKLLIEGRPLDPKIIAPLELEVNFTGPLESFVRKALDSRLKLGGAK